MTNRTLSLLAAILLLLTTTVVLPQGGAHHVAAPHDHFRVQANVNGDCAPPHGTDVSSFAPLHRAWGKICRKNVGGDLITVQHPSAGGSASPGFAHASATNTMLHSMPFPFNHANGEAESVAHLSYAGMSHATWEVQAQGRGSGQGEVAIKVSGGGTLFYRCDAPSNWQIPPGFQGSISGDCEEFHIAGTMQGSGHMPRVETLARVAARPCSQNGCTYSASALVTLTGLVPLPGPGAPPDVSTTFSAHILSGSMARHAVVGNEGDTLTHSLPPVDLLGRPVTRSFAPAAGLLAGMTTQDEGEPPCASVGTVTLFPDHTNLSFVAHDLDFEGSCTVDLIEHVEDETTNETVRFYLEPVNDVPVPLVSAPESVLVGETLTLDGSASFDVDGVDDIASYVWDQGEGTPVLGSTPTIGLDTSEMAVGHRAFRLMVTDHAGAAAEAWTHTVYVHVPPVAVPRLVAGGIDGSQSFEPDPTNDAIVAFSWSFGGDQPFRGLAYPDGRDQCGTLTVTDTFGAQGTEEICLAEAEARTRALYVAGALGTHESAGTGIDRLGADSAAEQSLAGGGALVRAVQEEAMVLRQGPNVVSSADVSLGRIDIPQALLTIEGVALEADAVWNVDTGATEHTVKRAVAKVVIGGVGVLYVDGADGPVEIPLPGGGSVSFFVAHVEQSEHGVTYREDAVRVALPGAAAMVFGSLVVQAGDHTMTAPPPFEA